jgi:hypothetical protein
MCIRDREITVKFAPLGESWGQEDVADCQDGATLVVATRVEKVDGREVITAAYMGDWIAVADVVLRWLKEED